MTGPTLVVACDGCVHFATPGDHHWIAGVAFVAFLVGVVAMIVLALHAANENGRRRVGWLLVLTSVGLLLASPLPLLVNVDNADAAGARALAIDCGRPLLSRLDIDAAIVQPDLAGAAGFCQREFSRRRTVAGVILILAGLAGLASALLLLGPRRRLTSPEIVGATGF